MNLIDIRKENSLTQKDAAMLIGIPYRTYIRYEENESYKDSYKYKKILEDLLNATRIDENKGVLTIDKIKSLLVPILTKHNISRCYLFGSYARNEAKENSDIDLLIDTDITGLAFFELAEEIRETLHKKIDLLRLKDLAENNPIAVTILKEGIKIL